MIGGSPISSAYRSTESYETKGALPGSTSNMATLAKETIENGWISIVNPNHPVETG
jgi:hypothetical protein